MSITQLAQHSRNGMPKWNAVITYSTFALPAMMCQKCMPWKKRLKTSLCAAETLLKLRETSWFISGGVRYIFITGTHYWKEMRSPSFQFGEAVGILVDMSVNRCLARFTDISTPECEVLIVSIHSQCVLTCWLACVDLHLHLSAAGDKPASSCKTNNQMIKDNCIYINWTFL